MHDTIILHLFKCIVKDNYSFNICTNKKMSQYKIITVLLLISIY